jgi:tRNA U55 pseudouridine synthase TruB
MVLIINESTILLYNFVLILVNLMDPSKSDNTNFADPINSTDLNEQVVWVMKPIGWNLTQIVSNQDLLAKFDEQKQKDPLLKLCYSGRLDPLACGLIPILTNRQKAERELFRNMGKTYQFKLLIGPGGFNSLKTDTYDIMGLRVGSQDKNEKFDAVGLNQRVCRIKGMKTQKYPPYSSKTVSSEHYDNKKKALWFLAQKNQLPKNLPERDITVHNIKVLNIDICVDPIDLLATIKSRIETVKSPNFRQTEIIPQWETMLNNIAEQNLQQDDDNQSMFTIVEMTANVSTGSYIRGFCNSIGGVAFDIMRTSVGSKNVEYMKDPFKFEIIE